MQPDDDKEGFFLHRRVYVDKDGWHEELEPRYVDDILEKSGMGNCNIVKNPGVKSNETYKEEDAAGQSEHSSYRSIAGLASYMCDRRGDINFATKESLRKMARPTASDMIDLKRICRYLRGVPRCGLDFHGVIHCQRNLESMWIQTGAARPTRERVRVVVLLA